MTVAAWRPGDPVAWRSRPYGQVGYVMPARVVVDTPDVTVWRRDEPSHRPRCQFEAYGARMVTCTHTLDGVAWQELADLVAAAGLGTASPDDMRRAYEHSALRIFAWDEGRLVGAARATSDGIYHAMLCDVVVLPTHQGRGIGRELVLPPPAKLQVWRQPCLLCQARCRRMGAPAPAGRSAVSAWLLPLSPRRSQRGTTPRPSAPTRVIPRYRPSSTLPVSSGQGVGPTAGCSTAARRCSP